MQRNIALCVTGLAVAFLSFSSVTSTYSASNIDDLRVKAIGGIEKNVHLPAKVLQVPNNKEFTVTAIKNLNKIDFFLFDIVKKPEGGHVTTKGKDAIITLHPQGVGSYEINVKAMKIMESG